ncbi:MAG: MerR family transcriptional regulator [Chloroflexi bacterium]|nr:MerR family transcriptional regulator [Chloroflexota bacterium]
MTSEVTDASLSTEPEFQIGEVAQRTGLTQRTLRFYEERGLVTPADRMEGGFRLYSEADIGRVELIKQLQGLLGFTLAEIKEMVEAEELRAQIRATFRPDRDLPERRERVEQVIVAVRRQLEVVGPKIEQLIEMRGELSERLDMLEQRLVEIDEALAGGQPLET